MRPLFYAPERPRCPNHSYLTWRAFGPFGTSPKSSRDVVVRLAVLRCREDLLRRSDLHELTHVHEGRDVRNARGLLQVVRDHSQAILLAKALQRLFDPQGGNGVEGCGRLV